MEIFHVVLFIVDVFPLRINFFSSVEVEVNYGPSQYVFFGVLIFSIGITRCTICAISKIIGKGYNILCFHRYFDVMLFFIGNSQWFCISSEFPSAVSQLFLLSLYKSFSTRHINHYRRHQPDQFKCYSMQEDNVNMNVNIPPHPPPPHPTPSRKLHERYCTPPHPTQVTWTLLHPTPPLHASYMNVITPHPTPSRKLHERYYTPPLHASYMNVITPHPTPPYPTPPHPFTQVTWTLLHPTPPHPFTQVTWTLLHPTPPLHASYMNVITPHPTPPLHASYMNVITPHPTPPLHASYMNVIPPHPTPPLHASYMNVITPHPTPPLHASYMNVITPHPTPPLPPLGEPPPPRVYIYKYVELSICKDAVTMRRCSSSAHMFGLVYFLSW